jgi:hypothetical protein
MPQAPTLDTLQSRLRTLLPDTYQETPAQPAPMRSAGLKYTPEGLVAWDQIWGSFCDLALAGGPPHRGTLLSPGTAADIATNPAAYAQVTAELCRGLHLVTGLYAQPATPGWLRLDCTSAAMANWLSRAITMENIAVTFRGLALHLPAGPAYRPEKEIKNVITAVAKTSHYWLDHTSPERQQAIADLLRTLHAESPLLQPTGTIAAPALAAAIHRATGLHACARTYPGWLGIDTLTVPTAITLTRLLVASNVLTRREDTTVFLPIDTTHDPDGIILLRLFLNAHTLAQHATR